MYYERTVDKKKAGSFLKKRIIDRYGTIVEYAKQTGQVYKTVHSWTAGYRLPELEDMVANCNILDIPLEYVLLGTNLEVEYSNDDVFREEDEFRKEARWKYPNLTFCDVAMIIPLINMRMFEDIVNRVIDCSDSFYVCNLFSHYIRTDSDAWKYCVYVLQQRNSPLVIGVETIEANKEELYKWAEEYQAKKKEYKENKERIFDAISIICQTRV